MEKNYKKLLSLYHEFHEFLFRIHGLYLDSIVGFELIAKKIEQEHDYYQNLFKGNAKLSTIQFLDNISFSHSDLLGRETAASGIHFTKKGQVRVRNQKDGSNHLSLGNFCIVIYYSYWETYFRKNMSEAIGIDEKELLIPIWGDLRILRRSILHNKNRLQESDKRKIEILKWVLTSETIIVDQNNFRNILMELLKFRNWIHTQSMPEREGIIIPKT